MLNMRDFAMNLISSNPQFAQNPQAQELINVIRQGDSVKGEQIATNICQTYGITPQQAIAHARQYFHMPF